MSDRRDYRAEFGHAPSWHLQRKKQTEHGVTVAGHDGRSAECENCGSKLAADSDRLVCMNEACGKEYPFK